MEGVNLQEGDGHFFFQARKSRPSRLSQGPGYFLGPRMSMPLERAFQVHGFQSKGKERQFLVWVLVLILHLLTSTSICCLLKAMQHPPPAAGASFQSENPFRFQTTVRLSRLRKKVEEKAQSSYVQRNG